MTESDFAHATFERALAATCRLTPLGSSAPHQTREKDQALADAFTAHCAAFRRAQGVRPEVDLEALRASALEAYTTVRQRHELRKDPEPVKLELLPWDEEDERLANY